MNCVILQWRAVKLRTSRTLNAHCVHVLLPGLPSLLVYYIFAPFSYFFDSVSASNDQVNAVKTYEHLINGLCDGQIANAYVSYTASQLAKHPAAV